MDFHNGTTISHKKVFEILGFDVQVFNLHCYKPILTVHLSYHYRRIGLPKSRIMHYVYAINIRYYKFLYKLDLFFKGRFSKLHLTILPIIQILSFGIIKPDHSDIYDTIKNLKEFIEILPNTNKNELDKLLNNKYFKKYFSQFDYLFCSFPPAIFQFVKLITDKFDKTLILNIGHRFNIWIKTPEANQKIKADIIELFKKHIVGAASEYDYRYTKHYLNLDVDKLYIKTFQIPLSKKNQPKKNTILIGPASFNPFNGFTSKYYNIQYELFCAKKSLNKKFIFRNIKEELPDYRVEDLSDYFGFIIYPYCSFSVSALELYECNLPYFYPSVTILKQHKPKDYILYPIYCTKDQYRKNGK